MSDRRACDVELVFTPDEDMLREEEDDDWGDEFEEVKSLFFSHAV